MSPPRRPSGEIHILAMLDGHARRSLSRRLLAVPMAWWYGGGGLLACVLVGLLAWPAGDVDKAKAVSEPVMAAGPAVPIVAPEPDGASVARAAPIVPATPAAPDASADAPVSALHVRPALPPAPATARAMPAVGRRTAAHAAPPRTVARRVQRPAPKIAPNAEKAPARTRRVAAAARTRPTSTGLDTDVALISAIIQHGGTPPEAAPRCAGGPCTYPVSER